VHPDSALLVTVDGDGKLGTQSLASGAPLSLNDLLKEHRKVHEQEATIALLNKEWQATAARQQKQIEALTAGLQKVSAQLEVRRPAPRNVDDIMAASFGVRQSERILVRSCEAGRDLSATTVAVNLRSK
jgi:lysozyme family protein